ncbi:Pullulanase precursor [compost metagenome]
MRTKQGVENSYKCPIEVNWLDWGRCAEYTDEVQYLTSLIELRKQHPAFRLKSSEEIREHLHFEEAPGHTIAYTLRNHAGGDPDQHLYVIYHANHEKTALKLPSLGEWEVRFGQEYVLALSDNIVEVHGIGMVVLGVRNS